MPADLTRITKQVQMRVPGVLDAAVTEEIKATFFEFFSDAPCWLETVPFTTLANTTDYVVEPINGEISMLLAVSNADGSGLDASFIQPNIISLGSAQPVGQTMTAVYSLLPIASSPTDIPDWVVSQYWLGLADGVIARLMSQPSKPYTNETFAKAHYAKFRSTVADAKREALRAYRFRGQPWRFPRGFA